MLKGILEVSGMLTLKIVYGDKYGEKAAGRIGFIFLFSLLNALWLICLIFSFAGGTEAISAVVLAIAYPVAIAVWAMRERKAGK